VTVFALARLDHQYLLYGIAAAICLVVFVTLILTPALSAYGRIWEKAAAGFLSLFVLAALVIGGVVVGLAVVYYYTDITNFINGI
jgi:ABC-type spermidine/putrescine transport system permease subunit II